MTYSYRPRGVCSQYFEFEIENDIIQSARILGGCSGNLQAICRMIAGQNVQDVAAQLKGIRCGMKPTSCPDQIAAALEAYMAG